MKPLTLTVLAGLLSTSVLAHAQSIEGAAEPSPPQTAPSMRPNMATMPMHQQMQEMRERMAMARAADDPEARRKLMMAHMESMQGMMKMMHGMMAGQATGRTDGSGARGHRHSQQSPTNAPCEDRTGGESQSGMKRRMNMMQMMMDQMLEHQSEALNR